MILRLFIKYTRSCSKITVAMVLTLFIKYTRNCSKITVAMVLRLFKYRRNCSKFTVAMVLGLFIKKPTGEIAVKLLLQWFLDYLLSSQPEKLQ
jgi:hypothetical protein